jgi:hypothetical protein
LQKFIVPGSPITLRLNARANGRYECLKRPLRLTGGLGRLAGGGDGAARVMRANASRNAPARLTGRIPPKEPRPALAILRLFVCHVHYLNGLMTCLLPDGLRPRRVRLVRRRSSDEFP